MLRARLHPFRQFRNGSGLIAGRIKGRFDFEPQLLPGDVLILDNLSSHKVAGVRAALQRVGADVLYLPPYSPDFNPIEQAFSKLKRLLRSAGARTVDTLWHACGDLLTKFTANEFQNYLAHCGYRYS